ncbi:MAG: hypothetical protein EOM92_13270 [Gammaproteobacteria bacterium]|nr:hypothetical protein [Gammaproteobacteria bacterium]
MDQTYTLTLTARQLRLIDAACETCARAALGQVGDVLRFCRDRHGTPIYTWERMRAIEDLVKPAMGLAPNESFRVGHGDEADTLWDLHQVLRHRLAWDAAYATGRIKPGEPRNWADMLSHNFDEPLRYGPEPLATVSQVSAPSGGGSGGVCGEPAA